MKCGTLKNFLFGVFLLLILVAGIFLLRGWLEGHFASADSLRAYIGAFGLFGPVVLTLLQMLQVILPVLPGFLGCILAYSVLFGALI